MAMASHGKARQRSRLILAFFQCQISVFAGLISLIQIVEAKKQEASNNSLEEGKR